MSLPLLHAGRTNPGLSAALDLRFALDKSLTAYRGPTPSFSRASTGTYFNSSGVLTSAAINAPRFNHTYNGTSWVSRGLLVEEQRTNQLTNSNNFASSFPSGSAQLTSSATTSPDGTTNASKIYESASGGGFLDQRRYNAVAFSGSQSSFSIYAKAAERRRILLFVNGPDKGSWFDLISETCGNDSAYTGASQTIQNVGNGWYRCTIIVPASAGIGNLQVQILLDGGTTAAPNRIGDGVSGFYIAFAQIEIGAFPTSYIGTTSSAATRSADVCQITGGDFSGFWNGTEGSFAVEYDLPDSVQQDRGLINANDGTNSKYISLYGQSASGKNAQVVVDSALQVLTYGSTISANTSTKMAACWKLNDFVLYSQGTQSTPDTSGAVPSGLTQLEIGKGYFGGDQIRSGHIARLRYYSKRLPNATLQLLSEPDPTLNLQFALNKSLTPVTGPAPSFSRASTGTYFNASGVLTSASINTPRFDHVFSGGQWASRGLLVEEQRTNTFQYSHDFSNAYWSKYQSAASTDSTLSPDGSSLAWLFTENTANDAHALRRLITGFSTGTYTLSCYAKAGTRSWINLNLSETGIADRRTWFNLSNGTIGTSDAGNTATITNVGNGWYRCTASRLVSVTNPIFDVELAPSDAVAVYVGDGSSGAYFWGAQLELGSFATSYIPSLSNSSTTRSADVCQIAGTSFGWMWNQGEGSFLSEVYPMGINTVRNQGIVSGNDGTFANVVGQIRNISNIVGDYGAFVRTGNSTQVSISRPAGSMPAFASSRAAFGYKVNDFADSLNGVAPITDTVGTVPTVNRLTIGDFHTGADTIFNGCISQIIYYPARLTNSKLQQLST